MTAMWDSLRKTYQLNILLWLQQLFCINQIKQNLEFKYSNISRKLNQKQPKEGFKNI